MAAKRRAPNKTGNKTGTMRSPRSGAECPTGAHSKNTGGKKGRSGRKPNAWKEFCGEVLDDPKTRAAIRRAIQNPKTSGYAGLVRAVAEDAGYKQATPHSVSQQQVSKVIFEIKEEGPLVQP